MSPALVYTLRYLALTIGSVVLAFGEQVATKRNEDSVAGALVSWGADLAVYVGLSAFISVVRGFYDARDGRIPDRSMLRRAVVVSMGVGLVGGLFMAERSWPPGIKMGTVCVASFFLDIIIPILGRRVKARAAELMGAPVSDRPTDQGGDRS